MSGKRVEVVGKVYGRLTIIRDIDPYTTPKGGKQRRVSYLCSCGADGEARLGDIRNGSTRSCGCLRVEATTKHGKCDTRLYRIYGNILNRCNNPKGRDYVNYGGRGIRVCEEWLESFETFDMWAISNGYEEGLSIERIDVNGDYTPTNCSWIPMAEQALNKRMLKNNTSGITGVSYNVRDRVWVAKWKVGGKTVSKSFSVKKYRDAAKQMAIDKRKEMEKLLGITNNDATRDSREHLENIGKVLSDGDLGLTWLEDIDLDEQIMDYDIEFGPNRVLSCSDCGERLMTEEICWCGPEEEEVNGDN